MRGRPRRLVDGPSRSVSPTATEALIAGTLPTAELEAAIVELEGKHQAAAARHESAAAWVFSWRLRVLRHELARRRESAA